MDQNIILTKIIDHLKLKDDKQDDLNGIILAIYESEIKKLHSEVIQTLSLMIKKSIIDEFKDSNRKTYYRLIKN